MKYLITFVAVLVGPLLVGCDKSTPAGAGGKAANSVRIPEGLDNRHAANFLAGAKHFQEIGEPEQAAATLNELITKYPESDSVNEAKQILAELEKSSDDAGKVQDGGAVTNINRDTAQAFLTNLQKVKSIGEEKKLLTEFGAWLRENGYKIETSIIDGAHHLSCPFFPPETPWVKHVFLDSDNLSLLPLKDNE